MSGLRASLCAQWQPRQPSKDVYEAEHGVPRSSSAGTSQDTIKASAVKSIVANSNIPAVDRPTCFLDLPLELRQKIYDPALPREHNTTEIPALLRCNLQICRGATALSTPVLTTTFAGGYDCDWSDQDRKMSNMRAFAARAQRLVSEGREPKVRLMVECSGSYNKLILKPLQRQMIVRAAARVKAACDGYGGAEVRIELMCHCGSLSVDWQLAPLLQVIRTTPMPKVEVYMTKSKTCRLCRRLMSYRDDPVDDVRSMVERAEMWRDTGAMRVGIHPR